MTYLALDLLTTFSLDTPKNKQQVLEHPSPYYLGCAMLNLKNRLLLSEENFIALCQHQSPVELSKAFLLLQEHHLLDSRFKKQIIHETSPIIRAKLSIMIHKLLPEHELRIRENQDVYELLNGLTFLQKNAITDKAFISSFLQHPNPMDLAHAYLTLKLVKLLNTEYIELIVPYHFPNNIATIIYCFHRVGILNRENIALVLEHPKMNEISFACTQLYDARLLNQTLLNFLLSYSNNINELIKIFNLLNQSSLLNGTSINQLLNLMSGNEASKLHLLINDLKTAELLDESVISYIQSQKSIFLFQRAIAHLKETSLLNQENLNKIKEEVHPLLASFSISIMHQYPPIENRIEYYTSFLHTYGLFNEANEAMFLRQQHPLLIVSLMTLLNKAKILSQERFELICTHQHPNFLVSMLINLEEHSILTPQYQTLIQSASGTNIKYWTDILILLKNTGLLNPTNLSRIQEKLEGNVSSPQLKYLFMGLSVLQEQDMLDQTKFDLLLEKINNTSLFLVLNKINRISQLNEHYFNLVHRIEKIDELNLALKAIYQATILNSVTFAALIEHPNLFQGHHTHPSMHDELWSQIPPTLLTRQNFKRLVLAAEQEDPFTAIFQVKNEILKSQLVNPQNSTHRASMHQSVSLSALKLKEHYGLEMNVESELAKLCLLIEQLNDTPKHLVAKRCIIRITNPAYSFIDRYSSISIHELLAFCYRAIHDPVKRQSSLEDAIKLFVEGLYEIQRGYNLNNSGEDLGGEDVPICAAGTFNKIIEKLNGIHADVELKYITHELASIKFPILAQEVALNYLKTLANPSTPEDYRAIKILLATLELDQSLEPIWDKLKDDMTSKLWEEFHEAYADNPEHPKFKELIEYGASLNLPALDSVEHLLYASPGYRAYVTHEQVQCSISFFSLFIGQESERLESDRPQKRIK